MKPITHDYYTVDYRGEWVRPKESFDWRHEDGPRIYTEDEAVDLVIEHLELLTANISEFSIVHHQMDVWPYDVTEEVMARVAAHYEELGVFPRHEVMQEAREEWEARERAETIAAQAEKEALIADYQRGQMGW